MYEPTTAEHIDLLTDEYRALLAELKDPNDLTALRTLLMERAEWSELGSAALIRLARRYGTFVLSNALALAEALEIEDGEAGI